MDAFTAVTEISPSIESDKHFKAKLKVITCLLQAR